MRMGGLCYRTCFVFTLIYSKENGTCQRGNVKGNDRGAGYRRNVIFIRGTETYFVNYTAYGAEFGQLINDDVLPYSSHRFHTL